MEMCLGAMEKMSAGTRIDAVWPFAACCLSLALSLPVTFQSKSKGPLSPLIGMTKQKRAFIDKYTS